MKFFVAMLFWFLSFVPLTVAVLMLCSLTGSYPHNVPATTFSICMLLLTLVLLYLSALLNYGMEEKRR